MEAIAKADLHPAAMRETRAAMRHLLGAQYLERVAVYQKLIRNIMSEHDLTPEMALEQIINILDATAAEVNHVTLGLLVSAAVEINEIGSAEAVAGPCSGGLLYA
jgi:hypothetical protein